MVILGASCQGTLKKRSSTELKPPTQQLKEEIGRQSQLLAEKEALIKQLEQGLLSQQRMLDDAIQEVVRIQAKQRSLESRAEAASEMAEAEIALKALSVKAADSNRPELANAEQLLSRASTEFARQNFGGALYLVTQAKSQIKVGALNLNEDNSGKEREAEMPFAVPLPLKVRAKGNLREGPGQEFKVLLTLNEGSQLTGFFTKGQWLRVESPSGVGGWIHRSLVSAN